MLYLTSSIKRQLIGAFAIYDCFIDHVSFIYLVLDTFRFFFGFDLVNRDKMAHFRKKKNGIGHKLLGCIHKKTEAK